MVDSAQSHGSGLGGGGISITASYAGSVPRALNHPANPRPLRLGCHTWITQGGGQRLQRKHWRHGEAWRGMAALAGQGDVQQGLPFSASRMSLLAKLPAPVSSVCCCVGFAEGLTCKAFVLIDRSPMCRHVWAGLDRDMACCPAAPGTFDGGQEPPASGQKKGKAEGLIRRILRNSTQTLPVHRVVPPCSRCPPLMSLSRYSSTRQCSLTRLSESRPR